MAAEDIRYTYSINNIESVQIDLQSPMTAMPLPQAELGDAQNILVKAEGNAIRISIQWNLVNEASSVVASNGAVISSAKYGGSVNKADEMVQFLTDEFQLIYFQVFLENYYMLLLLQ